MRTSELRRDGNTRSLEPKSSPRELSSCGLPTRAEPEPAEVRLIEAIDNIRWLDNFRHGGVFLEKKWDLVQLQFLPKHTASSTHLIHNL